ncbi:acyltransferase family protein [Pseudoxanthomonas spadix]|uniref:acyltransferase family protein n=1 Tax=Pseudoxanthomonas spadix TaxID=415229 RepID=UPI001FD0D01A|nr:acyltransferase [Pseudoxanthomonas spadix]
MTFPVEPGMQNPPPSQAASGTLSLSADPVIPRTVATAVASKKKEHMPALDGLRGLAAISVVVAHLPTKTAFWEKVSFGECGVFLFFVLSGFLMTHLHLQQPINVVNVRRFCVARVARIVPLYYAIVLMAFAVSMLTQVDFHYRMDLADLVRLLAFAGSVDVFWSVGPEFQFYGFFLLLWWIPSLRGRSRTIALALLGVFVVASYVASPYLPGILFVSKLHIFLGGIGIALLRHWWGARVQTRAHVVALLQLMACAALWVMLLPYPHMLLPVFPQADVAQLSAWYYTDLPRVLLAALVVLAFSYRSALSDLLLGNGLASELGRSSFSIYLLHRPVIDVMTALGLFDRLDPWSAGIGCIVATVLLAWLANRALETPARVWITRRFMPARPRSVGTHLG